MNYEKLEMLEAGSLKGPRDPTLAGAAVFPPDGPPGVVMWGRPESQVWRFSSFAFGLSSLCSVVLSSSCWQDGTFLERLLCIRNGAI